VLRAVVPTGSRLYRVEVEARTVEGAERAALWPHLVARYPMFDEYQRSTDRQIPVVALVPV